MIHPVEPRNYARLIQQRLSLYRFCLLEFDATGSNPPPWYWPGLTAINLDPEWKVRLSFIPQGSLFNASPVCSSSIKALIKIRRFQPSRPLLLLRTPYESVPFRRIRSLPQCVDLPSGLLAALNPDDPLLPLRWISPFPTEKQSLSLAHLYRPGHPLICRADMLRKHDPSAHIFNREDGAICIQASLFSPPPTLMPVTDRWEELKTHNHTFLALLNQCCKRMLVVSQKNQRLHWFSMDLLRLAPVHFHCRFFPWLPLPNDPHPHFVLINQQQLRFFSCHDSFRLLELDSAEHFRFYRLYRCAFHKKVCFHQPIPSEGSAHYSFRKHNLFLQRRADQWELARTFALGQNLSQSFASNLEKFQTLTQIHPIL